MMRRALRRLRVTIKGRAFTSREVRKKANQLEGMEKHELHLEMRDFGANTRYYLLAYALLRGLPYGVVEQCRPENFPDSQPILYALKEAFEPEGSGVIDLVEDIWENNVIRSWLGEPNQKEGQMAA
jgi:hypothetical protein